MVANKSKANHILVVSVDTNLLDFGNNNDLNDSQRFQEIMNKTKAT